LNQVAERCSKLGVGCILENKLPHLLFANTSDLLWILATMDTGEMGVCLDTGHANLTGDIYSIMHKLSRHLRMVHAHDNHGNGDEHLPPGKGYIDWSRVLTELELQGLLLCGGRGRRLSPRYKGNGGIYPVYECTARLQDTIRLEDCIHIQANLVDQAVSQRVLEVLQPEQFQIALRAVNEMQERSEAIDGQWRMRIERLDYQAQLAQRRYEQVDPSHRLVAATLEQRWNQALEETQRLKDDYQKYRQQQGLELTG
jgi:hypothetical protein